jgi:hypothetical protein
MLGNQHVRFGGGRMEKEQAIATSPAVYPTAHRLMPMATTTPTRKVRPVRPKPRKAGDGRQGWKVLTTESST